MKQTSSYLYDLVQTMTRSEKRYFKIYAQQHIIGGKNDYVKLFDAIVAQKEFDEDKLKKKLAKHINLKSWAVLKNYLYNQLLDGLYNFQLKNSIKEQIKQAVHAVDLLLRKGLVDMALSMAKKTEKQIANYGLYEYAPELLLIKLKCWKHKKQEINEAIFEKIRQELEEALSHIDLMMDITQKEALLIAYHWKKGVVKQDEEKDKITKMMESSNLTDEVASKNLYAYTWVQSIKSIYATLNNNHAQGFIYLEKAFLWYEAYPHLIDLSHQSYIATIGDLAQWAFASKQEDTIIQKYLQKLMSLPKHPKLKGSFEVDAAVFRNGQVLLFLNLLMTGQFEKALKAIPETEAGLKTYEGYLQAAQSNLRYQIAFTYFMNGKYEKTLDACESILVNKANKMMEDVYYATAILQLITHYELDNDMLVEYTVNNLRRRNAKKGQVFAIENALFLYLKKAINLPLTQRKDLFQEFLEEAKPLKNNHTENRPFIFFFYIAWLKAKATGRSFQQAFDTQDADWR